MTDKEKIRAEIVRQIAQWKICHSTEAKYRFEMLEDILSFIDSMQEEPVSEDLEEAASSNGVEQGRMEIINALYKLLDSMKEEPAGDDLEEAAKRYNEEMSWRWEAPRYPHLEAFKAGAQWQKEKDEKEKSDIYDIAVDVGRKLGEADMKQQMMKGATDGQIENGEDYLRIKCLSASCRPQDDGKMVKLIIIKED